MMMTYPTKAPSETSDYRFDWTAWLAQAPGDSAVGVSVAINPAGLAVMQQATVEAHPVVWLGGGTSGQEYRILWTLTTAAGRLKRDRVVLVLH